MATVTNQNKRIVEYQNSSGECPVPYNNSLYGLRTLSLTQNTKPNTITRAKPSSLIAAQTSRVTTNLVRSYGIYKDVTKGTSLCGSIRKPTTTIDTTYAMSGGTVPTYAYPNNNLSLREDCEMASVQLGDYIAEYKQTADLFIKSAEYLRDAWKTAHGRLPRKYKHYTPRDVSAAWLHSQFALKPLVGTMSDALSAHNERSLSGHYFKRILAGSEVVSTKSSTVGQWNCEVEVIHSLRSIRYVTFDISKCGISFGNPLEWVWEAIPFSFVVDWFIPIGDTIGSLNALSSVVSSSGCDITKVVTTTKGTPKPLIGTNPIRIPIAPSVEIKTVITRVPMGNIGLPSVPRLKPNLTRNRCIDAVALLHLLTKGKT